MPSTLSSGLRLQERAEHGHVRLGAGVRLDVRVIGAEQLLRAVDRELLGRRRRTRTRRSSDGPDSPRRTCCSSSSRSRRARRGSRSSPTRSAGACVRSRSSSFAIASATSGSVAFKRVPARRVVLHVTAPLARSSRSARSVGRAVRPRTGSPATPGRSPSRRRARRSARPIARTLASLCSRDRRAVIQVVAERRADPVHLVRGDLLALARAAEHDPAVRAPVDDRARGGRAERRVVDRARRSPSRRRSPRAPPPRGSAFRSSLRGKPAWSAPIAIRTSRPPPPAVDVRRPCRTSPSHQTLDPRLELPRDRAVGLQRLPERVGDVFVVGMPATAPARRARSPRRPAPAGRRVRIRRGGRERLEQPDELLQRERAIVAVRAPLREHRRDARPPSRGAGRRRRPSPA